MACVATLSALLFFDKSVFTPFILCYFVFFFTEIFLVFSFCALFEETHLRIFILESKMAEINCYKGHPFPTLLENRQERYTRKVPDEGVPILWRPPLVRLLGLI